MIFVSFLFIAASAVTSANYVGGLEHVPRSSAQSIRGPLMAANFPDPAIFYLGGTSYAFATRDINSPAWARPNVQIATSTDNKTWTLTGNDAMPIVGAWEAGGSVWAPDVVQLDNGKFVLYYADVPKSAPGKHCIGAATSNTITGHYTPQNSPLVCPDPSNQGGAIDPEGFRDPATGRRYVIYKIDGNSLGHGGQCGNEAGTIYSTPLMLQEVAGDGVTLVGAPVRLLDRDASDGPLIEAPAMRRSAEGVYFLFYSSHCFRTGGYDVKYATATNVRGPYTKASLRLLGTGDGPGLDGPGGMDAGVAGDMVVFHGIVNGGKAPFTRGLYTARIGFSGRTAYIL